MISRFTKTTALLAATITFAGTAAAGGSHHSTLPSLGSWTGHTSTHSNAGHVQVLSASEATARYGSGSISQSYTVDDSVVYSGSSSAPGLAANESLQATNCPVNVHGVSEDARVVGCYNVVRQVPQTTYYRDVRPIVYVRYPVAIPVCRTQCCEPIVQGRASRYGGFNGQNFAAAPQFGRGPVCR